MESMRSHRYVAGQRRIETERPNPAALLPPLPHVV